MGESHGRQQTRGVVDELASAQRATVLSFRDTRDELNALQRDLLAIRYRRREGACFGRLVRRPRVVGDDELDDLMDEGVVAGAFDEEAALDLRLADLIVHGRRPNDDRETFLVVEVSVGVGAVDVERATRRAAVLRRIRPALPVVAGDWVTPEARRLSASAGVWCVLNGRTLAPDDQQPD